MKTTKQEMENSFKGGVYLIAKGASNSPEISLQDVVCWTKELIEDIEKEIEWENGELSEYGDFEENKSELA